MRHTLEAAFDPIAVSIELISFRSHGRSGLHGSGRMDNPLGLGQVWRSCWVDCRDRGARIGPITDRVGRS